MPLTREGEYATSNPLYAVNVAGFTFYGHGPEIITYNNLRRLGATDKKTKVGRPYKLKVISDDTTDTCGVKDRRIVFQVVDVNGRGTGKTRVVEHFFDKQYGTPMATAYNSCRQEEFQPIGCEPTDLPNGKTEAVMPLTRRII